MSLIFGISPWWLLPALLLAGALTYWVYRRPVPPISNTRRAVLVGLRFSALSLLILLLLEPIIRQVQTSKQPPLLAVLVDASKSIGVAADSTVDRPDQVRGLLEQINASDLPGQVRFFQFSTDPQPFEGPSFDSLAFNGPRTDISRALTGLTEQYDGQNLRGVLLLSDGQYNTGKNPIYQADEFPVPIHTVTLGDTARPRDVQIRRVNTNEIAYVNTKVPVEVQLRSKGFSGKKVTVTLNAKNTSNPSQTVTLASESAEQFLELPLTPQEPGLHQFTVSVTELSGEQTHQNNTARFSVRVLEKRKQILLVAGAPSPDLSAIYQTLKASSNNEIVRRTQTASGGFYEGALPEDVSSFDAVVLVGYPGPASSAGQAAQLAEAAGGSSLVFVLGRQTNLSLLAETFGTLLPVQPQTIRSGFKPVLWTSTSRGKTHPILNLSGPSESPWANLPPLQYNESNWQASPDASVLATVQEQGITLDNPLLVVRRRSGRRAAAFLGSGVYRWHNLPESARSQEQTWPTLFSNIIQWVTTRENDQPVQVEPTKPVFDSRETVVFSGEVYNESLEPVDNASVEVTVTAPDSTTYPYPMQARGNGRYNLSVGSLPPGTYTYTATARQDTVNLGSDQGSFAVGTIGIEFLNTRANPTLMRQISRRSGGFSLSADSLREFNNRLAASKQFTPVIREHEQEVRLWQWPLLLGLLVALVSGEWILRKRSGMV